MERRCRGWRGTGLPAVIVFAAAWVAPGLPALAAEDPEAPPEPPKAEVKLSASPRHGFRPLTVTLTGTLLGVDAGDQDYCHAGVEWEARTPLGVVTVSREDPKCLHPPEEVHAQFVFTKIVTISRAGYYSYRLIVHRRDGDRLLSNTQEIRVLDNQ